MLSSIVSILNAPVPQARPRPQPRQWLWQPRLARGFVTAILADPLHPGLEATLDIAARVSAGAETPDGAGCFPASRVLVLARDDGHWLDDLLPRLLAAGADPASLDYFTGWKTREGEAPLQDRLSGAGFGLLVLPDATGYPEAQSSELQTAASILRKEAAKVARVIVQADSGHPAALLSGEPCGGGNGTGRAQNTLRGQPHIHHPFRVCQRGSRYWLETQRPPARGPLPPLSFDFEHDRAGGESWLVWQAPEGREAAKGWLQTMLAGGPLPAATVREAAARAGIAKNTLYRAKADLGIISPRRAVWELPRPAARARE